MNIPLFYHTIKKKLKSSNNIIQMDRSQRLANVEITINSQKYRNKCIINQKRSLSFITALKKIINIIKKILYSSIEAKDILTNHTQIMISHQTTSRIER